MERSSARARSVSAPARLQRPTQSIKARSRATRIIDNAPPLLKCAMVPNSIGFPDLSSQVPRPPSDGALQMAEGSVWRPSPDEVDALFKGALCAEVRDSRQNVTAQGDAINSRANRIILRPSASADYFDTLDTVSDHNSAAPDEGKPSNSRHSAPPPQSRSSSSSDAASASSVDESETSSDSEDYFSLPENSETEDSEDSQSTRVSRDSDSETVDLDPDPGRGAKAPTSAAPASSLTNSLASGATGNLGLVVAGSPAASCCSCDFMRALRASVAGFVSSSGFIILGKDFWEGAAAAIFQYCGADPTEAPTSYIIASLSGAWYGAWHQVVSRLTFALLAFRLGLSRSSPDGTEWERQWREFLATTLPGLACYVVCHAVRGLATVGTTNIWVVVFAKVLASCAAGALGAFIADLIAQRNPDWFRTSRPGKTFAENFNRHMEGVLENCDLRKFGHDFVGKYLGSTVGIVASVPAAPLELPGSTNPFAQNAGAAALGKFVFQVGFYGGMHLFAFLGGMIDSCLRRLPAGDTQMDVQQVMSTVATQIGAALQNNGPGASPTADVILVLDESDSESEQSRAPISGPPGAIQTVGPPREPVKSLRRAVRQALSDRSLDDDQLDERAALFLAYGLENKGSTPRSAIEAFVTALPASHRRAVARTRGDLQNHTARVQTLLSALPPNLNLQHALAVFFDALFPTQSIV
jgi:ABC-type Co2+ transport system permease subunit